MNKEQKREYARKYYQEHKEEKREYYQKHKEMLRENRLKHKERIKEYYLTHKEEMRESQKEYKKEHKEEIKNRDIKRKIERPWTMHFYSAKQRCNYPNHIGYKYYGGRGIKFLLTMDEIEFLYKRDNAKDMDWASIDRINNDGNYVFGNCRFIEHTENIERSKE